MRYIISCKDHISGEISLRIGYPKKGNHPLKYQYWWYATKEHISIERKIHESFSKLYRIAERDNISYEQLVKYAISSAENETKLIPKLLKEKIVTFEEYKKIQLPFPVEPFIRPLPMYSMPKRGNTLAAKSTPETLRGDVYQLAVALFPDQGSEEQNARLFFYAYAMYLLIAQPKWRTITALFKEIISENLQRNLCGTLDEFGGFFPPEIYQILATPAKNTEILQRLQWSVMSRLFDLAAGIYSPAGTLKNWEKELNKILFTDLNNKKPA